VLSAKKSTRKLVFSCEGVLVTTAGHHGKPVTFAQTTSLRRKGSSYPLD
jgi:hypothetical protein